MLQNCRFPVFSVAFLSAIGLSATSASAQVSPGYLCYYITNTGRVVNLESICGEPGPIDAVQDGQLSQGNTAVPQQQAEQTPSGDPTIIVIDAEDDETSTVTTTTVGEIIDRGTAGEAVEGTASGNGTPSDTTAGQAGGVGNTGAAGTSSTNSGQGADAVNANTGTNSQRDSIIPPNPGLTESVINTDVAPQTLTERERLLAPSSRTTIDSAPDSVVPPNPGIQGIQ